MNEVNNLNEWYLIENINEIDSPALVIYPDRVKENIRLLVSMIDDVQRLRPHVKTHKTQEAALLMLDAGIGKFKCATIAEAEMLAMAGAPDVLLAYQPGGPKLQRFVTLIKQYPGTKFSCLVDNICSAESMCSAAVSGDVEICLYLDLNVGMNRTGIPAGEQAIELYKVCFALAGIKLLGLHAYDGHIGAKNYAQRTAECNDAFEGVKKMQLQLMNEGFDEPVIVAGGSPTFPVHAKRKNIECSPGTFIYWDKGYLDNYQEQPFLPAALVITRVISLPDQSKLCLDLGHKSVSAENDLQKRVCFLNAPELKIISQSEEHLVVEAGEGHSYTIGDIFYGLPVHICPTCALYERAITVENNQASGEWKVIARDRKINL